MAFGADSIGGDGLFVAHRALAALSNPERLQHARLRFDEPPPPYTSDRSGTTTRSQSPNPPGEAERNRQNQLRQLNIEHHASRPYSQFEQQTLQEEKRLMKAHEDRTYRLAIGQSFSTTAYNNVKKQWDEQGLWSKKWNMYASGKWKHEEPLEPEPESETDSDAPPTPPGPFFGIRKKPRRKKSEDKRRRNIEIRAREREASRPYHQFIYQLSHEQERIHYESGRTDYGDDINSVAYQNVKCVWRKRGIWNEKWQIMPGMTWKHEKPWEEVVAEYDLQSGPVENNEAGSRSNAVSQPPVLDLPATHRAVDDTSMRDSPAMPDTDDPISGTTEALQSSSNTNELAIGYSSGLLQTSESASGSRQLEPYQLHIPSTASRTRRANRRKPSRKSNQSLASTSLAPVHASKVSKPKSNKKLIHQSRETAANDTAVEVPRRRSARLRTVKADTNNDSHEAISGPRTRRKVASKS